MAHQHHLHIFTPADSTAATYMDTFKEFPALPPELRVRIWQLALERSRIIRVNLRSRESMDLVLARQGETRPETREDERYGVVVGGYQTVSKLLRVCRESREIATAFYRVQLPCWLVKGATRDDMIKPGILYFNPENDFLSISNHSGRFVDLFHDLKTVHDPRNVGLLNLAVDDEGLIGEGGLCYIDLSALDPSVKTSFVETLTQLREVFFVHMQSAGGRPLFPLAHPPAPDGLLRASFPIAAVAPNFNRLGPDPRPISRGLEKAFPDDSPYSTLDLWRRVIDQYLGGRMMPHTELRILLTFIPIGYHIYGRKEAEEWLRKENIYRARRNVKGGQPDPGLNDDEKEEVEAGTAFGFWLFPVQAFGGVPKNIGSRFMTRAKNVVNLEEYWPDLVLLNLPG